MFCSKVVQEVFDGHSAIKVFVKGQEGLPQCLVVLRYLGLDSEIERCDTLSQRSNLLCLILRILAADLLHVPIFVALVLLVQDVQLWEENLSELVE